MPDQTPEPLTEDDLQLLLAYADCIHPGSVEALIAEVRASRTRIDRVTELFEKWAAEESEHRAAGEYGLAEGLHVAIEELRMAVHGTHEEPYRD